MATSFENVRLASVSENGESTSLCDSPVKITLSTKDKVVIGVYNGKEEVVKNITVNKEIQSARIGAKGLVITNEDDSFLLNFTCPKDMKTFLSELKIAAENQTESIFTQRTDSASAEQYFQFYGYLSQQQNMMQDYIRTSTYQRAMLDNTADFQDKVVMDVGAGSGILSFFAVQAGAKKVYAIEASSMALHCEALVKQNRLTDKITVIAGKIEEVEVPEQVDIIISEPMGYMLFNERMLETFLHAKKWLKPGGKMFPTQGDLHIAPFTDDSLYMEQFSKANFWYQPSFHGVDLSNLREAAVKEYFRQPIVDTFDMRICLARSHKYVVDFQTAKEEELHDIEIPLSFTMQQSGTVHGLAFWFDVAFLGSQNAVWLSTAPTQPLTHWYQVRCLLQDPIFVKQGQTLAGKVHLISNSRQSYDVEMELQVPGTSLSSSTTLDLKNPFFRYTGQQPIAPPGTNQVSPSDQYWNQAGPEMQVDQANFGVNLLNGANAVDAHNVPQQQQQQQQVLAGQSANVAPVNPGSIPTATIVSMQNAAAQQALQMRTSVGGGLSPQLLPQASTSSSSQNSYPISNQFMIGDYVLPGSMVLPSQGLNLTNFKAGGGV